VRAADVASKIEKSARAIKTGSPSNATNGPSNRISEIVRKRNRVGEEGRRNRCLKRRASCSVAEPASCSVAEPYS